MTASRRLLLGAATLLATTALLTSCGSSAPTKVGTKATGSNDASTSTTSGGGNQSGGSDDYGKGQTTTTSGTASGTPAGTPQIPVTPANAKGCRTPEQAAAQTKAPQIDAPTTDETGISVVDDIPGCGDLITATSTVSVQYILKAKSTGQVVDSSWSRNQPFSVTLGQGQVIQGWELGIPGMRAGGERTLTIGPNYGYGPAGSPPAIGANDTLVFVIDAVSVQ